MAAKDGGMSISEDRLRLVLIGALDRIGDQGAGSEHIASVLRLLKVEVTGHRVQTALNWLNRLGLVEFVRQKVSNPTDGRVCFVYRSRIR